MDTPQNKRLFVGLGNPGARYALTRHNFGFLVVEELASLIGLPLQESKYFSAKVAKGRIDGIETHLLLPLTYMNESGRSVSSYLAYYKITIDQVVVVCDDVALNLGQLRLRSQGSSGGHNGLKSVATHLSTEEFARLRMGIGSAPPQEPLADYVLSNFKADEMTLLGESVQRGATVLKALITDSVSTVMNRVNTKT